MNAPSYNPLSKFPRGEKFTTVFLKNSPVPTHLLLMQRNPERVLFANAWTGPGGHIEEGETQFQNATRELGEETSPPTKTWLTEFARLIVNGTRVVCYFTGVIPMGEPPVSDEGKLYWVPTGDVLSREIIPTTRVVLDEWRNRKWLTIYPYTVLCDRHGGLESPPENISIVEGLYWKSP